MSINKTTTVKNLSKILLNAYQIAKIAGPGDVNLN